MPIETNPEWQTLALYALGAALLLMALLRIPHVGRVIGSLLSFGLLAFCLFVLFQQAPFDPGLSRFTSHIGLDSQEVVGEEVRIRLSRDGHYWAQAEVNGVKRRMLIDSGATVTALSMQTADAAAVDHGGGVMPVLLRTANGTVQAQTGTIDTLRLGGIEARNLKVVVSAALGNIDVLGMNFLSRLKSWRVDEGVLVLVPQPAVDPA